MSLTSGRKVVAAIGTAEVLGTSDQSIKEVLITAETDNTGVITVGNAQVIGALGTRTGTPLSPGESLNIKTPSLADVWLDTTVNGDGVTYTAIE